MEDLNETKQRGLHNSASRLCRPTQFSFREASRFLKILGSEGVKVTLGSSRWGIPENPLTKTTVKTNHSLLFEVGGEAWTEVGCIYYH